jgi:proline iminopeptidase
MAAAAAGVGAFVHSAPAAGVREPAPSARRALHAVQEPHASGMLQVTPLHSVYWEVSGNPDGIPAVFVHGGPGGGTTPKCRAFFDPARYRIVLFDQRGCGKSLPTSCLEDITTWALVSDMEALRTHLGIDKWLVFGGSWGSTLALTYAQEHPAHCLGLVLRGVFLLRQAEIDWFYQSGASFLFPDAWDAFLAPIPAAERANLLLAFHTRLTGADPVARKAAAVAWSTWEGVTSKLLPDADFISHFSDADFADVFARIETHYFVNKGFFARDGLLLEAARIDAARHVPTVIVQGRYDVVCPARSAWDLKAAWPEARLVLVDDAGHSAWEPGITAELVGACDAFAAKGAFA